MAKPKPTFDFDKLVPTFHGENPEDLVISGEQILDAFMFVSDERRTGNAKLDLLIDAIMSSLEFQLQTSNGQWHSVSAERLRLASGKKSK